MASLDHLTLEYLYEAARFRGLAYFNSRDFEQVRSGGEVIYYVDAGVALLLYIWPGRIVGLEKANADYISNIGDPAEAEEIAEAALTGEFLLSDAMHARARALRDQPPAEESPPPRRRILQPHWTELINALNRFGQEGTRDEATMDQLLAEYDAAKLKARDLHKARVEAKRLAQARDEAAPPIDVQAHLLPILDIAALFERTKMLQHAMVRCLRFTRPLEPALRLRKEIQGIASDQEAMKPWIDVVRASRKDSAAAHNDAVALAQIEALNALEPLLQREAAERGESPSAGPTTHCLVTGDKSLHQAYFERKAKDYAAARGTTVDEIDLEIGDFAESYYLRHPGQFLPMLNQAELPNQIDDLSLFDEVVAAVDAALALFNCSEREALDLAMLAVRRSKEDWSSNSRSRDALDDAADSATELEALAEDIKEHWNKLRRATLLVNRHLLANRVESATNLRGDLSSLPEDERPGLLAQQKGSVLQIQRDTLFWAAREGIGALSKRLKSKGVEKEDRNRLALLADLQPLAGGSVYEAARSLKRGDDPGLETHIDANIYRLTPRETWKGLLLCSLLACYADAWSEAAWYAERACDAIDVELADDAAAAEEAGGEAELDAARAEATYLAGYAYRMRMSTGDFDRAVDALTTSEKIGVRLDGPLGRLIRARALSERATVHLFEQARRVDRSKLPEGAEPLLSPDDLGGQRDAFVEAGRLLSEADKTGFDDRARRSCASTRRQVTLNLCILDAVGHVRPNGALGFPDRVSDAELIEEISVQRQAWAGAKDESQVTLVDRLFLKLVWACLRGVHRSEVRLLAADFRRARGSPSLYGLDRVLTDECETCCRILLARYAGDA